MYIFRGYILFKDFSITLLLHLFYCKKGTSYLVYVFTYICSAGRFNYTVWFPCQGWEVTVIKQEESTDGPLEMQIALPSMPSLYIISFLYQACLEIHKIGGHILDRIILHKFAWDLLQKVCYMVTIYQRCITLHYCSNTSCFKRRTKELFAAFVPKLFYHASA